jgi:hypothetical protein
MQVGRRTKATARLVAEKVDAITSALRGIVVALVVLTVAVVTLAVRAA